MNIIGISGTENMYATANYRFSEYCGDCTESFINRKTANDRFLFLPENASSYSPDHNTDDKIRTTLKGYLSALLTA